MGVHVSFVYPNSPSSASCLPLLPLPQPVDPILPWSTGNSLSGIPPLFSSSAVALNPGKKLFKYRPLTLNSLLTYLSSTLRLCIHLLPSHDSIKINLKMRCLTFEWISGAMLLAQVAAQTTTVPVTGLLGNATVVEDNPIGATYVAVLPTTEFFDPEDPRGNIKGSVSGTAGPNGVGVSFKVSFSNLPTSGGPFRMFPQRGETALTMFQFITSMKRQCQVMGTALALWHMSTRLSVAR
jgi:hypothetical protein